MTGVHVVLRDVDGAFVDLASDKDDLGSIIEQAKALLPVIRQHRERSASTDAAPARHSSRMYDYTPASGSQVQHIRTDPAPPMSTLVTPPQRPQRVDETHVMPSVMDTPPPAWRHEADATAPMPRTV